jgi:hypothetical protein
MAKNGKAFISRVLWFQTAGFDVTDPGPRPIGSLHELFCCGAIPEAWDVPLQEINRQKEHYKCC